MKTLSIDQLVELNRTLTKHALITNKQRATLGQGLKRFRICPNCLTITEDKQCECAVTVH